MKESPKPKHSKRRHGAGARSGDGAGTGAAHTDIRLAGWWRWLPARSIPYLVIGRFDRPIGWWLLLLPGWWVIAAIAESDEILRLMMLFLVGAVCMRAAGCVVNDIWDRRLDRRVERTRGRPLAAGTLTLGQAMAFACILTATGFAVLLLLPPLAILAGAAALPLVVLYPLAKRVTWWPQAVLGLTFSWGVPLGWVAATAAPPPIELAVLYAGSVCWVFGYDTIYAVQDMEDDRKVGVKSSALGFGRHLRLGVFCAYALAVILIGTGGSLVFGQGIWLFGLGVMAVHFMLQVFQIDPGNPARAGALFKSNRNAGLVLTLAILAQRLAEAA